jgi:putative acetyltransferase
MGDDERPGIVVRAADDGDAPAIREIHCAAFPTSAEADLVERLQRDGDAILSLVAERDGRAGGHVLLSRMRVEGDGRDYRALGLGPVAVRPALQRCGLGSALIRAALAEANAAGEELIFLVGDPAYYRRFGFAAETAAPFASPYAGPYLMALALSDLQLPARGRADYPSAFAALEEAG